MGLSIKVRAVEPLENLTLLVEFENGVKKHYDVKQLIARNDIYEDLEYNDMFKYVKVDCGGYAVAWNDSIDISECELWENGVEICS